MLKTLARDQLLASYAQWLQRLEHLDLLNVASMKPVVDGRRIKDEFGYPRDGLWLKIALDRVIDWQLQYPDLQGNGEQSKTEAIAVLLPQRESVLAEEERLTSRGGRC